MQRLKKLTLIIFMVYGLPMLGAAMPLHEVKQGREQSGQAAQAEQKQFRENPFSKIFPIVLQDSKLLNHRTGVYSVSWSSDGKRLATGSWDRTARIWDAATGRQLHALQGHQDEIRSVSWSPDGKQLATGSYDGTARIWDAATGRQLHALQ